MAEHYTKKVGYVKVWCRKCRRDTIHDVYGGRKGGCRDCIEKQKAEPQPPPPVKQESLF
jgi:hypothetical protein